MVGLVGVASWLRVKALNENNLSTLCVYGSNDQPLLVAHILIRHWVLLLIRVKFYLVKFVKQKKTNVSELS